jgi:hypothetical protein
MNLRDIWNGEMRCYAQQQGSRESAVRISNEPNAKPQVPERKYENESLNALLLREFNGGPQACEARTLDRTACTQAARPSSQCATEDRASSPRRLQSSALEKFAENCYHT